MIPQDYTLSQEDQRHGRSVSVTRRSNRLRAHIVKDRFVSGKIKIFNGIEFELTDMTVEDAVATVAIADKLYADIVGFDLDPKNFRKVAPQLALPKTDEKPTETTLSEASSTDSQPTSTTS